MSVIVDDIKDLEVSGIKEVMVVMPYVFFKNVNNLAKVFREIVVDEVSITAFRTDDDKHHFINTLQARDNHDEICILELCTALPGYIEDVISNMNIKRAKALNFTQEYSE